MIDALYSTVLHSSLTFFSFLAMAIVSLKIRFHFFREEGGKGERYLIWLS